MNMTNGAYQVDIINRFTFSPPTTDEERENHEIVNSIFIDAAVKLSQICPQSPELDLAINNLAIARAMANASLAVHVNTRVDEDEEVLITGPSGNDGPSSTPGKKG